MNTPDKIFRIQRRLTGRSIVFWILLVVGTLGAIELIGQMAYRLSVSPQEDREIRILLGLDYNPNMLSNFIPHPYLVYVLNPDNQRYYKPYFGAEPAQRVNRLGFRGMDITTAKPEGTYRIVCMGGSTTFGTHERDERYTFPALLEQRLNSAYRSTRFEVINAGTPGWTSAETLINLQFRLLELSPDMVIEYEGVNDTFAMRKPGEGESDYRTFRQPVHYQLPGPFWRWFLRYSLAIRFLYWKASHLSSDINSLAVKTSPPHFDEGRALDGATGKYFRRNIETIVDIAKARGIVPVLVTMGHGPWHPSLSQTCRIVRDVAGAKKVLLVDFERMSKPAYFVEDHVHLQREGNQALAQAIFESLVHANLPFNRR